MKLDLDYQIHDYVDNHPSDNGYKYDHIEWRVRIHNPELLENINSTFNSKLILDDINVVSTGFANMIKEYCWSRKCKYDGLYGTEYKNDLLKQLFNQN